MSMLLLPELAREMASSNRRVAEFLEVESQRLEKLRGEIHEAETLKKMATRSALGATMATLGRKADVAGVWQRTLEILKDGQEGEQAKTLLHDVGDIIDSWLRLAQKSRALWALAEALGTSPEGLEELEAAEKEAKRVQTAVEKTQLFLSSARSPIDAGRLQKGEEDFIETKFKNPDEMRSRLGGAKA
jgi:hypothetical protein